MPPSYFRLRVATPIASLLAAILLALCAGAVWSVVSVVTGDTAAWMVVPTIYATRFGLSHVPYRSPVFRASLSALLVIAGTAYALYLQAASLITSQLGVPFGESVRTVGPTLAWMMMYARLPPLAFASLAAAPLVAATVEFVESRRKAAS